MSVHYKKDPVFVFILDVILGSIFSPESFPYTKVIKTHNDEHLSFVRILGTVTNKYHSLGSETKKEYTSLTVDDGTGVIQVKGWEDHAKTLDAFNIGDVVDVFAKPRVSKNQEIFLVVDKIFSIDNYSHELYLRAKRVQRYITNGFGLPKIVLSPQESHEDYEKAKITIWELIVSNEDGITFDEILQETGLPKQLVEKVIQELLNNGDIYEPVALKFKKI